MYNLLKFLKKYRHFLMFLVMEVLCVIILMNNLPYQKRKLVNFGNSISGKLFKTKTNVIDYFHLKKENQLMMEHNALLMSKLNFDTKDTTCFTDSLGQFRYIPAKVINNSIHRTNNFILIDKGKKDGLKKNMGVICEKGIVGKIVNVSDNYASVMSLLHPYSIVSARFTNNQHLANVCWENTDYRFGMLKDIPLHIIPQKGDTIVTSGYSNIYPADIMIGTIEEKIDSDSKNLNNAKILFSTNFSTLRHVYVIENIMQAEIDSLMLNVDNEQ